MTTDDVDLVLLRRRLHWGANMLWERRRVELTLSELSKRCHVSTAQLSRIETGQRNAGPATRIVIAKALGVDEAAIWVPTGEIDEEAFAAS